MFDNHISISIYYKILIKEKKGVQLLNFIYYLFNHKHQFKLLNHLSLNLRIFYYNIVYRISFSFYFLKKIPLFYHLVRAPSCALFGILGPFTLFYHADGPGRASQVYPRYSTTLV